MTSPPASPSVSDPSTTRLLREAVQQHRGASRRGLLERLFTAWFGGWVYNQIWEDPRVDAQALQLDSTSRILTIASGGCNVLNYLGHDPASIVAVDLNRAHLALTRLKLTALRHVPDHAAFYDLFGRGNVAANTDRYRAYLRPHLDEGARDFWEQRIPPRGWRRYHILATGLYERGRMGLFLRFVHGVAHQMGHRPAALLEAQTLAEQEAFFDEVVAPFFRHAVVQWVADRPMAVFSLGIPPQQHDVMQAQGEGCLIDLYLERLRKLVCGFPIQDNYFAWQVFGRRYDHARRQAIPDYLRRAHFDRLRSRLDRVETHHMAYHDALAAQATNSFDSFVLLDAQDWMSAAAIQALWAEIARVGVPGSRIIFRTAGSRSPVEAALPDALRQRFTYHRALSEALHARDRSAIYGMFHVYALTA